MRAKVITFAVIVLCVSAGLSATSVDKQIKSNTENLKKIQKEIKNAEKKVQELQEQESGVLKTIAEIDNGLAQTREYLSRLEKREMGLQTSIKKIEDEIEILQENIKLQKQAMTLRIKNLYIHGRTEEWELLYNLLNEKTSFDKKLYWVQKLLENDKISVETFAASIEKEKKQKEILDEKQKELAILRIEKVAEEMKLQNQLHYQREVLTKVKQDKSTQERAVNEYKRNQQALASVISILEKKRQDEIKRQQEAAERKRKAELARSSAQKTKVVAKKESIGKDIAIKEPVLQKCQPLKGEILSTYGYHTNRDLDIKIMHLGTEIRGTKGEPVKAAAAGSVAMTANLPGHGPSVIIDHGGSHYSVYGHLGSIKVKNGDKIKSCQEVGTVGNAESTNGYKLFFQVYKGTQTQDPIAWLRK